MSHNHPITPIEEEREHMATELYNRLHFLHWAIDDTQNTVRFLDTKAAFCVTLLSGMVAVALEHPPTGFLVRHILFPIFILTIACSVMASMRVIFPTIIPHGSVRPPATPKFFIGHKKVHHWVRHTIRNPRTNILSEDHSTYLESLHAANDNSLLDSMAETVVALSFIRQIKSDRLHFAMYSLAAAILLFVAIVVAQL